MPERSWVAIYIIADELTSYWSRRAAVLSGERTFASASLYHIRRRATWMTAVTDLNSRAPVDPERADNGAVKATRQVAINIKFYLRFYIIPRIPCNIFSCESCHVSCTQSVERNVLARVGRARYCYTRLCLSVRLSVTLVSP